MASPFSSLRPGIAVEDPCQCDLADRGEGRAAAACTMHGRAAVEPQTSNEGDGDALLRARLSGRGAGGGGPRTVRNCGHRGPDLVGAVPDRPRPARYSRGERTPDADALTSARGSFSLVDSPARVTTTRAGLLTLRRFHRILRRGGSRSTPPDPGSRP